MTFFTYRDANGLEHASYEDACLYYGADTPAQLAAEAQTEQEEAWVCEQDAMEARGGPRASVRLDDLDDCPF